MVRQGLSKDDLMRCLSLEKCECNRSTRLKEADQVLILGGKLQYFSVVCQ